MGIVLDDIVYYITMLSIFPAVILYVIARAVTLVLAFTSLKPCIQHRSLDHLHTSYMIYIYIYLRPGSHLPTGPHFPMVAWSIKRTQKIACQYTPPTPMFCTFFM